MRLLPMVLALSTLCSTSCTKPDVRVAAIGNDPAKLATCPTTLEPAPHLTALAPFLLTDGRSAVLLDTVIARETATAHYIIAVHGGWALCRSVVDYVIDRDARLTKEK
jgi:hypothetical protein